MTHRLLNVWLALLAGCTDLAADPGGAGLTPREPPSTVADLGLRAPGVDPPEVPGIEVAVRRLGTNAAVVCWIADGRLRCIEGTGPVRELPAPAGNRFESVAVGDVEVCAWSGDAPARCWTIADEQIVSSDARSRGRRVVDVALDTTRCLLEADGSEWCWDREDDAERRAHSPWHRALMITPSCASDGERVACRGPNGSGQVGPNCFSDNCAWTHVELPFRPRLMTSSISGSCVVAEDRRTLACWGGAPDDLAFRRGRPSAGFRPGPEVVHTFESRVLSLRSWGFVSCALLEDRSAWCWHDRPPSSRPPVLGRIPRQVATDVNDVASASGVLCTLSDAHVVRCWGDPVADRPLRVTADAPGRVMNTMGPSLD